MEKMIFSTENLNKVFAAENKWENFETLRSDLIQGNQTYDYDEEGNRFEISKKDANKAVRKVIMEVCGLTEESVKSDKRRKRAVKDHYNEVFEIIERDIEFKVQTGLDENEWFQQFVESRNVALGDDEEFEVKQSDVVFTVAEVSGDHHDLTMQFLPEGEYKRVHQKKYGIKIGSDINLVLLGRRDYTALIDHISAAYQEDILNKCYTAMYGAAASLPNKSQFNKGGALSTSTKTAFDTLLEDVATANRTNNLMIVGTKMALKKLTALADVDWADDKSKADYMALGRLGTYESTTLVEIPQRFKLNDVTEKMYSNDILFIFANTEDKFVKLVDKGETEILEQGQQKGDLADDFQKYEVQRSYGVGVMLGQYFGVWNTDTSASI